MHLDERPCLCNSEVLLLMITTNRKFWFGYGLSVYPKESCSGSFVPSVMALVCEDFEN